MMASREYKGKKAFKCKHLSGSMCPVSVASSLYFYQAKGDSDRKEEFRSKNSVVL